MSMEIYLGAPPASVVRWAKEHGSGTDKPEEKYMGPLCFTAQEDNPTVGMIGPFNQITGTSDVTASLQISKDEQKTWTPWDGCVVNLNSECENGKLYVKALNSNSTLYDQTFFDGNKFVISGGKVAASGNIQYLLDPTGERMDVPEFCYSGMFYGCKSLTQAPELPATTLANYCYSGMFNGCTSLIQAPELPATTLASNCYFKMFYNCNQLLEVHMKPDCGYDPISNGRFNDSDQDGIDEIEVKYDL